MTRSSETPHGTQRRATEDPGRRDFLIKAGGLAATGALLPSTSLAQGTAAPAVRDAGEGLAAPFKLGVASGDPLPDSVVIWTRLVADPLAPGGGMPERPVTVDWEVAADETFRRPVLSGSLEALPQSAHAVHVEVGGLEPARHYWYRFVAGGEASPVGRTRTAPAPGARVDRLRFAFASCQKYETGFYTAYEHMAEEDLDLVVFLGDYIYERAFKPRSIRGLGLPAGQRDAMTLEDYRLRYALYKSDPLLQAVHAAFPWVVAFDDHEVENDWGADLPRSPLSTEAFLARRAAAFQAYWEHMPLRRAARPRDGHMALFRRLDYGGLASFHVLDTRQYRSPNRPCGAKEGPLCPEAFDPARSILGASQERWLMDGLARSRARWNILAQQVQMARLDFGAEAPLFKMDKWDAYPAARARLFEFLAARRPANPVVITGDLHNTWVSLLKADFDDPASATLATEFICTSITTGGNGAEVNQEGRNALAKNPHLLYHNDLRGYVRCEVTGEHWLTEFRNVPYIKRHGAPISTRARFVLENGDPVARSA